MFEALFIKCQFKSHIYIAFIHFSSEGKFPLKEGPFRMIGTMLLSGVFG